MTRSEEMPSSTSLSCSPSTEIPHLLKDLDGLARVPGHHSIWSMRFAGHSPWPVRLLGLSAALPALGERLLPSVLNVVNLTTSVREAMIPMASMGW